MLSGKNWDQVRPRCPAGTRRLALGLEVRKGRRNSKQCVRGTAETREALRFYMGGVGEVDADFTKKQKKVMCLQHGRRVKG
jgi:hypothetical protein